ncbi:MAG: hypothetical protein L0Z73_10585, partial [Gammaproteobacteria bacterium]|nr:hypothetical protein [Gammaproteobacteria bacterium]
MLTTVVFFFIYNQPAKQYTENWVPEWQFTQSFQEPRRALATAAAKGYIYVIGGMDQQGQYVTTVEYAKINPDGSLGPWRPTAPLNEGRFYLAAVTAGDFIFALGGGSGPPGDGNYPVATVERAVIQPDGTLSEWQKLDNMQTPRRGLKAIVYNRRIYAIGGYSGEFLKSTEHALVDQDGNPGEWQIDVQEAKLDRYIHSASIYRDRLYLLGGHVKRSDKMSYGDVESSVVAANGHLNPWIIEKSQLILPRFIASAFTMNGRLYILGGHNGANRLNHVEFAAIDRSGHVGEWRTTTALNIPR